MHEEGSAHAFALLPDGEAFHGWLTQYPGLSGRVVSALLVLEGVQGSLRPFDLVAGRDAANTVMMVAYEHGFQQVGAFFSGVYDGYCRALLLYWP